MRPLFFVGNKRSGTSHLGRLLNLHPRVAVTHESDCVWLLYRAANGLPLEDPYPWDGDLGLRATLGAAGHLFDRTQLRHGDRGAVRRTFTTVQLHLLRNGSAVQQPGVKPHRELIWLGDKKPVQQADPEILDFTLRNFPDARFVHIVRHPAAAVTSMLRQGRNGARVAFWRGDPTEVVHHWGVHERWALAAAERAPVHRIRYEDLVAEPEITLQGLFSFLDVETDADVLDRAREQTHATPPVYTDTYDLEAVRDLMDLYAYA